MLNLGFIFNLLLPNWQTNKGEGTCGMHLAPASGYGDPSPTWSFTIFPSANNRSGSSHQFVHAQGSRKDRERRICSCRRGCSGRIAFLHGHLALELSPGSLPGGSRTGGDRVGATCPPCCSLSLEGRAWRAASIGRLGAADDSLCERGWDC